ncbi:MAG: hypothetical protein KF858_01360 [Candidatus Sumerlaeia bacterium]|nr:hypothetical protein [Candidatus Sumerlaeia bacterium]
MIHIEFDNERNIPEESVHRHAAQARQWDARLRRLGGLSSRTVAAQASAAAGMIASQAARVAHIRGGFAATAIDATPIKADYRAALEVRGGLQPRDLPWLACERAISGDYDVSFRRVGFRLALHLAIPPATVTLHLHTRADEAICPDEHDATIRIGVAEVPLPLYLPPGMRADDLAKAFEVVMPLIERSALDLWLESEGGTREVF